MRCALAAVECATSTWPWWSTRFAGTRRWKERQCRNFALSAIRVPMLKKLLEEMLQPLLNRCPSSTWKMEKPDALDNATWQLRHKKEEQSQTQKTGRWKRDRDKGEAGGPERDEDAKSKKMEENGANEWVTVVRRGRALLPGLWAVNEHCATRRLLRSSGKIGRTES